MVWFRVDDGFYGHPKVLQIPRAIRPSAIGTWILCGTWSASKTTDGKIPSYAVEEVGGSLEAAEALVVVKLWRSTRTGYAFNNWEEYQYTRVQVDARRESERVRKAKQREGRRSQENTEDSAQGVPPGHFADPNYPNPSRTQSLQDQDLSVHPPLVHGEDESYQQVGQSVDNSLPGVVVAAVQKHVGREIDTSQAWDVMGWLMDRRRSNAEPIKLPFRYYPAAIARDKFEIQQYLDGRAS